MNADAPRGNRDWLVSAALAVGAFLVFVLLPQRVFHGYDTDFYALPIQVGDLRFVTTHVAYVPLCWLVRTAFGLGPVQAMLLTSAMGSATSVFFLHRAARRFAGTHATLAAIAVAVTPSCFYFATAPEVHGAFAAGSGAAWWAFARWWGGHRLVQALVLASITGAAATVHSFGHLLPPTFVAVMAVQRVLPIRQLALPALCIAAVHAGVAMSIAFALGHGAAGQGHAAVFMLDTWSRVMELGSVLTVTYEQCIVPYLPWSVLALLGLAFPRARPWSLAYVVALALHAPLMCLLLARTRVDVPERGAYLLPTALPAVLATLALLRRPWSWLAVLASGVLALLLVVPRWSPVYRREFVDAVARLDREQSVAFLVGPDEIEGVRTHLEGPLCLEVLRSMAGYFGLVANGVPLDSMAPWFDQMLVAVGGQRRWIVTRDAQRCFLQATPELWRDHVTNAYDLVPVQFAGLEGAVELRRRN